MQNHVVTATEFKAKCLALLDQVEQTGVPQTITKRGRPVAEVRPPRKRKWRNLENLWAGKGRIAGNMVNLDTADDWNVVSDPDSPCWTPTYCSAGQSSRNACRASSYGCCESAARQLGRSQ